MTKLVDYVSYCVCCRYWEKDENDEPCETCLTYPVNEDSHRPVKYESKNKELRNGRD